MTEQFRGATVADRPSFTVKTLLAPLLRHPRFAQVLKYTIYAALVINFLIYAYDDWLAFKGTLPADAPLSKVLERFATSIDMLAWLGLVFLFELETYTLSEKVLEGIVGKLLPALRLVCYLSIAYAVYGYLASTLDYYTTEVVPGLRDLCQLADQGRSLQTDVITYVEISRQNCASLAGSGEFVRVPAELAVVDRDMLNHLRWMGWIDVQNALVWLTVVFLIEVEIRLQAADRFSSRLLRTVRRAKTAFYGLLSLNLCIWVLNAYYIYAWDAFLWIYGFWAIELNLAEWELDRTSVLAGEQEA